MTKHSNRTGLAARPFNTTSLHWCTTTDKKENKNSTASPPTPSRRNMFSHDTLSARRAPATPLRWQGRSAQFATSSTEGPARDTDWIRVLRQHSCSISDDPNPSRTLMSRCPSAPALFVGDVANPDLRPCCLTQVPARATCNAMRCK